MLRRIEGAESRVEPFPFVCARQGLDLITTHLATGNRAVHSLLQLPRFQAIAAPAKWPAGTWINLNTPADFERFVAARAAPP
jgi:molybdopterin-guanine dinucleotide biosynthesis protein A